MPSVDRDPYLGPEILRLDREFRSDATAGRMFTGSKPYPKDFRDDLVPDLNSEDLRNRPFDTYHRWPGPHLLETGMDTRSGGPVT